MSAGKSDRGMLIEERAKANNLRDELKIATTTSISVMSSRGKVSMKSLI